MTAGGITGGGLTGGALPRGALASAGGLPAAGGLNKGPCPPPLTTATTHRVLTLKELCERRIAESIDTRNAVGLLAHAEAIGKSPYPKPILDLTLS